MNIALRLSGLQDPAQFAAVVQGVLKVVVTQNRGQVRKGLPSLYRSGVRYREEPPDDDTFRDGESTLDRGHGDCAHLCAWRVAELQEAGEPAKIRIKWGPLREGAPRMFHVQIRRADGSIEDPSRILGM